MTREDILDALTHLEYQLEQDYVDINGWPDEVELFIVREAIKEYRVNHDLSDIQPSYLA